MGYLADYQDNNVAASSSLGSIDTGDYTLPEVPSYLVGADNHQLGNTGTSILDPSTWGDRADNFLKLSVAATTRAVVSTVNSAVAVGELLGVADKSNEVSTKDWLQSMDDDLGKYYEQNQSSVDIIGDIGASLAPGLAGIKVLNWAQKGIALASEGRAGLSLAAHFGTLASKQAKFAELAQAEIVNSTNTFSLINANLAKSIAAGYGQNALEMAAFNIAAANTMQSSPLFDKEDWKDITYNSLLGGGFIGAGIMGTATAVKTISAYKKAGNAVDAATNAFRTVATEPADMTPASEKIAIHLNNIEAANELKAGVTSDDALKLAKIKGVDNLIMQEENNGRLATHALAGQDLTLANSTFDVLSQADAESASTKLAGATKLSRAGTSAPKLADTEATQVIKLFGQDAGKIYDTPNTLYLADTIKGDESAVMQEVNSFKHKQGQDWNVVSSPSPQATEARYIKAIEGDFDPTIKIGTQDIPYLERAYTELVNNKIPEGVVTLKDGNVLDRPTLYHYLMDLKGKEALRLQSSNAAENELMATINSKGEAIEPIKKFTNEDIAKLVNVNPELTRSASFNLDTPQRDLLAMQTTAQDFTDKMVAAGKYNIDKGTIKTYLKPQYAKITYDTEAADAITEHEIDGMTALKEQQQLYRQQALNVTDNFGITEEAGFIRRISGSLMQGANRESVGGGIVSSMNANYLTIGSVMQATGAATEAFMRKQVDKMSDILSPSGHAILNDSDAGLEFTKIAQLMRQTPENYQLIKGRGLVNIKQLNYEADIQAAQAAGKDASTVPLPKFEDVKAPVEIPIETEGMKKFADDWDSYNQQQMTHTINLRASQGLTVSPELSRRFYIPPVDGRKFPHFAFVVDPSITSTGHISMIHANTPGDLEALADKARGQGFKVLFKDQSEDWHRAMKDYDYDLSINENYINSAMKRTGVSAPTFPVTDPKVLWDDLINWRKGQDAGLTRDMIEHRYSPEFAEFRRQGAMYDLAENSTKSYIPDVLKAKQSNPYTDYIKAALYQSREGTTPIWSALNRLAETSVDTATARLQATFTAAKTPEDLSKINDMLKEIGVSTYQDAATYALANHTAPKPALNNFIRKADALLTFFMLKSDPLNAVNNGLGHTVLYGTELPELVKTVLGDAATVTVPGTTSKIISPAKFAAQAHAAWWDKIIGGEDGNALYQWAKDSGHLPSYTDQFKTMADYLTIKGGESGGMLDDMGNKAFAAAKKIDEFGSKYSGNNYVEEFNRFRSAVTAKLVTDEAIKQGKITADLAPSIINTFVNRVEGVHLAAQRPLMFKGAIGQALGLFQTYQFNMLQQVLRHVGDGNTKATATLLGLQGSIYGMNGLPAFNAMNTYIVGNAGGNTSHNDIVSTTYNAAGKEAGDWLLYGLSSNMLLHPDAKMNLYSRGDINPRQVTVIPTNFADVPIVGATAKFFGSAFETIQKTNNGAPVWNSLLQGIEHSGISRPLSGFAQAMEATTNNGNKVFSTDNNGNIVMENDLFSAMTAARLLGAKPLDEAVALDAFHRVQVYNAANMKKIETLGESIKATTAGGEVPTPEQIQRFSSEYAQSGGKQQQFNQFYTRQVLNANRSKVNQMIRNGNTFQSQYMQKIMGGYDLSDFTNNNTGG